MLILIGALGALVLAYLYFFVYYTSVLIIDTNVENYEVELFSSSTAQKWTHSCEEKVCEIPGVSPFTYNISVIKGDYETQRINMAIKARSKQSIVISLEKKVRFDAVNKEVIPETKQEKIQRIKNEKIYYKLTQLENTDELRFLKIEDQLQMQYVQAGNSKNIAKLPLVLGDDIRVSSISRTDDVFISLGKESYIYHKNKKTLEKLPFGIEIDYVKGALNQGNYLVVTQNGTFLYDSTSKVSEFQYLFHDFVYSGDDIIGVVLENEEQKKKNFSLSKPGNLIIRYSQSDKTREILYSTKQSLDSIVWRDDKIIFSSQGSEYELINFQ